MQEVLRITFNCELKIAVLKPVGNTLLECGAQVIYGPYFHNPLDLLSRHQAQSQRCDDSEETVSAVNQMEQLGIFSPAAIVSRPCRVH